jgi:urea transport system ATP-binding protein
MGKTTLLKCIMGLLRPQSGAVTFDGTDLTPLSVESRARLGIGYVPQGREIFPQLTVEENLRVGLGVRKGGPRTIPPRIFELFPVLKADAASARRRPVRRAAAAARDRARAGPRSEAVDPR